MTNFFVLENGDQKPVAKSLEYLTIEHAGFKIGIIGLAEDDWVTSLLTVDPKDSIFVDPIECAHSWSKKLREEHKCDFIIALTHLRVPNDQKLAKEVQGLDLILGGHDHMILMEQHGDVVVVKSGADFRTFGHIHIEETPVAPEKNEAGQPFYIKGKFAIKVHMVNVTNEYMPDPHMEQLVQSCVADLHKEYETVIAFTDTDLEGRFGVVRLQETNIANFIADIALGYTDGDFYVGNTGTIRNDSVIKKGPFKYGDLKSILPFEDFVEVALIPGAKIREVLENSVSKFPAMEGRFPMIGGMQFAFDPEKEPGSRVVESSIIIQGKPLDPNHIYKMTSKKFMTSDGRDGFSMMKSLKKTLTEENGIELSKIILHFFDYRPMVQAKKPKEGEKHLEHKESFQMPPELGLLRRMSSLTSRTKCSIKTAHLIKEECDGPVQYKRYKIIGPTTEERIINLGKKPANPEHNA